MTDSNIWFERIGSPLHPESGPQPPAELSPEEAESADSVAKAMLSQNNRELVAQLEERPLAKKQEALQETEVKPPDSNGLDVPATSNSNSNLNTTASSEKPTQKALLKNDDTELLRLSKA